MGFTDDLRYNVFQSELIAEACLDRIVHKAMNFSLSGESLRKNINFANDTEDHQRTERISPELVNEYRPEYAHLSCKWSDTGKYFDPRILLKFITEQLMKLKIP